MIMDIKILSFFSEDDLKQLIKQCVREEVKNVLLEIDLPPNKEPPKTLNTKEVAELLDVSITTIHNYKSKHMIPYKKIGGRLHFERDKVLNSMREFKIKKQNNNHLNF